MTNNVGVNEPRGRQGAELGAAPAARLTEKRDVRFVEPGLSRGGRRFEPVDERHLHQLVESLAASLPPQGDDVLVLPEMPSPLGLPDFVALVGGESWLDSRIAAGIPPVLSEIECAVLAGLSPLRSLRVESIARRIGWTEQDVEGVVVRLSRNGAVSRTPTGALRLEPALMPSGAMFAVEAKLKDWRRAVLQGRSYRTWSDNYVVVLGNVGDVAEGRAKESIRNDGGGLFTDAGWLVRPRSRRSAAARRMQGFEHLFAALSSDPTL